MIVLEVTLRKGLGNPILNAVRGAAFFSCPVVRPIAFKVGGASNVLSISDTVIEDMTSFISGVCKFNYAYNGNRGLVIASCECNGELLLSELLRGSGIASTGDCVVLHSTAPITVEVIFAFRAGNYTSAENSQLVKTAGYEGFTAINSRHCNVESFTFKHLTEDSQTETFEVSVKTVDGQSADVFVQSAIDLLLDDIKKIKLKC